MIRMGIPPNSEKYERESYKTMINMKIKRISFMLTFAPCSTKNWTISNEFVLIAILRGHSLILREFL